jgi:hypothetical protein
MTPHSLGLRLRWTNVRYKAGHYPPMSAYHRSGTVGIQPPTKMGTTADGVLRRVGVNGRTHQQPRRPAILIHSFTPGASAFHLDVWVSEWNPRKKSQSADQCNQTQTGSRDGSGPGSDQSAAASDLMRLVLNSRPARPRTSRPVASTSDAARIVPSRRTAPSAKYCRQTATTATEDIAFRTNPALRATAAT